MRNEEKNARALADQLRAAGIEARFEGGGTQSRVEAQAGGRTVRINCFWYEAELSGLMLGMNPANARSRLGRAAPAPYQGPEYQLIASADGAMLGEGRTRTATASELVGAARRWLSGVDLDAFERETPFINEERRPMRLLAQRFDPRLRLDVDTELWAYGEGRSCRFVGGVRSSCAFRLGQQQVAFVDGLDDPAAAASAWLIDRVPIAELESRVPAVRFERGVELIERDPAAWHWAQLKERCADPGDVMHPLTGLVEVLAKDPIANRFYSFTSLTMLCFSASSHYPWVTEGLPWVARARNGAYAVGFGPGGGSEHELAAAAGLIIGALAACRVTPFFGTAEHHALVEVSAGLRRRSNALEARLVERKGWYCLEVAGAAGRRVEVDGPSLVLFDGSLEVARGDWPTAAAALDAVVRFCEHARPLGELKAEPGVKWSSPPRR